MLRKHLNIRQYQFEALLGANHLRAYLKSFEEIGMNHMALNLRFNEADTEETMKRLADDILPEFSRPDFTE